MTEETPEEATGELEYREEMVLSLDPPYPVFAIRTDLEKAEEVIVQEPLKKHELETRMRGAIPSPFKPDEERFLPGVAYGDGIQFVMEIGESFGTLDFHEDYGWFCRALVPKNHVMGRVVEDLLKKLKAKEQGTFTQRLVKKTAKNTEE